MKHRLFSVAAALTVLTSAISAFGLEGEHMSGFPLGQHSQWHDGMADMLNCANRVYGFFDNFLDFFFFQGDAGDFNDFIARYAKLEGVSHKLTLVPGRGETTGIFNSGRVAYDWLITMSFYLHDGKRHGDASVALWVGGQVELAKVDVPTNVVVKAGGGGEDITKFVAAHEAKRKEKEETTSPTGPNATQPDGGAAFKSERLLFGKVSLTEDGSKVLSAVLDESGGTRSGYDLLYADTNFNGRFEESERFAATAVERHGSWLASSSFSPIQLNVPFNEKGQSIENPCQVSLGYRQYPRHGVAEEVSVTVRFKLRGSDTEWEFAFSGGVKPAKSLEKASVWSAQSKPTLEVFARPDGYIKGNLGLGLTFAAGENKLEYWKGGQAVKAQALVRKPSGKAVHRGEATPDKFSFG